MSRRLRCTRGRDIKLRWLGAASKPFIARNVERYSLRPSRHTIYTVGHTGLTDGITSESESSAIAALNAGRIIWPTNSIEGVPGTLLVALRLRRPPRLLDALHFYRNGRIN